MGEKKRPLCLSQQPMHMLWWSKTALSHALIVLPRLGWPGWASHKDFIWRKVSPARRVTPHCWERVTLLHEGKSHLWQSQLFVLHVNGLPSFIRNVASGADHLYGKTWNFGWKIKWFMPSRLGRLQKIWAVFTCDAIFQLFLGCSADLDVFCRESW